jgi:hypothetical protein
MTPTIPPALRSALTDPDQAILLVLAAEAGEAYERTAVALAEARAGQDRPTILADGAVTAPRLHELLGVENLEGLADIFLFGASLPRVVRRPEGRPFDFIPAGAYVPDAAGVLDSPRWGRIGAEVRASGAALLLYVPANTPGIGAISRRLGRAIVIGSERDAIRAAGRLDRGCHVLATVAPDRAADPAPAAGAAAGEATIPEPMVLREKESARATPPARATPLRLALLLALIVALTAAGWFLYRTFLSPPPDGPAADEQTAVGAPAAVRGEPVETPLPVSVAVEAHQDLTEALDRVAALRRAEPRIDFYLSPVAVSGGIYYRLLAGPVADAEAGTALLQRLVDAGHKTAFDSWAVRPTGYAFLLGEYDSVALAERRVGELGGVQIPAYVVRVRYQPGPHRYRVYGGAFETSAEAEVMKQMLEEADVAAELVPRTGEPIA